MSAKQLIIGAASAVVLSNIRLTLATITFRLVIDDFPPLSDSKFDSDRDAAHCTFRKQRARLSDNLEGELELSVKNSTIQTHTIKCPRADNAPAFIANYFRSAVSTYKIFNSSTVAGRDTFTGSWHLYDFGDSCPPRHSGVDLLGELNQTGFCHERARLFSAVRKLDFPSHLPILTADSSHEWESEAQEKAADDAVFYTERVCSAVRKAIKRELGSFRQLCAKVRDSAEAALVAARRRGWVFNTTTSMGYFWKRLTTKIVPPAEDGQERAECPIL
ncbi:hypothetical protein FOZ63_003410 [Perkinsus olseni]|uniref:Uncharacterized protein n=1 Tax=Perkinsus olseni TaxID=32597 RepID=A0A7J6QMJ4_PEROL|nr:hypothetical protein FOZ62_003083 [Perkinsus olseni]KAF4747454.1 hypothetical protein FOZ63_003410 [Perkinsus olseni]